MRLTERFPDAHLFPQFIVSKIVKEGGKLIKKPCSPHGIVSSLKDKANWMTLEAAIAKCKELGAEYGPGFVFTRESGFFFIDIDGAAVGGDWSELAKTICKAFEGCYVEISKSGTGLHIIGRYNGELSHKNKNIPLDLELYTDDRFVMLGDIERAVGRWDTVKDVEIRKFIEDFFSRNEVTSEGVNVITKHNPDGEPQQYTDEEALERGRKAPNPKAAFGTGASFNELYTGDIDALASAYPTSSEGKAYNASVADMALCNRLGGATGYCKEQMIRLLWASGLVREKWYDRKNYVTDMVTNTINTRQHRDTPTLVPRQGDETGGGVALCDDMPAEFEGCYFVMAYREIYSTRYGLVNQEAFNLCYHVPYIKEHPYKTFKNFAALNGRIVEDLAFRPDLPHGHVLQREGFKLVNIYQPLNIPHHSGDMTPFFTFFNAMIPNERDRRILLTYAALLVQKPGVKSSWCIAIQGVQGCGKSLFSDFVAHACGNRYTHRGKGDEFENRFNDQWFGKTLILIEDPQLKEARLEEALKPLITSTVLSFEGKGTKVRMKDFPANFIITLNDFSLLRKTRDARRFAAFRSGLQTPEDLSHAGLTPAVFREVITWRDKGGYEIVTNYLLNYPIDPEFDYSGNCVTAPDTSSLEEVITDSRSEIEIILLEEIELERSGFRGGWVSSVALTDFLTHNRLRHLMPDNRRSTILRALGYILHPGLSNGRAVRNVQPDNKRPALFVTKKHPSIQIMDREDIMKAYENAQKVTG